MDIGEVYRDLGAFFDGYFLALLIATSILFMILFVTWWIYKTLSKRNVFHLYTKYHGMSYESKGEMFLYVLKFFFLFPLYSFLGFLVFSLSLFILINPSTTEMQTKILFLAVIMVSVVRVSAYINEAMAEDFSKLIPLNFVFTILLTHPELDSLGITWEKIDSFMSIIPGFLKYFIFIIMLEAVLRGCAWAFGSPDKEEHE